MLGAPRPFPTRRSFLGTTVLAGISPGLANANLLELLMFERMGCPWCRRWDKEIGAVYPQSAEGQRAPLRRISLDHRAAPVAGLREPVLYSPTFVLSKNGREIGRITGYIHAESFWGLLEKMIRSADLPENSRET
jgi:hypothetical protein